MNDICQDYFEWLCELGGLNGSNGKTYWMLAKDIHDEDFVSLIPHDENRSADGLALREDYFYDCQYPSDEFDDILDRENASMLEVLIALAKRMDFELSDPDDSRDRTKEFVFVMLENLGLDEYDDDNYADMGGYRRVKQTLDILIDREYEPDGRGGLFPLTCPEEDQREIEIWYQMMAYLDENYQ